VVMRVTITQKKKRGEECGGEKKAATRLANSVSQPQL